MKYRHELDGICSAHYCPLLTLYLPISVKCAKILLSVISALILALSVAIADRINTLGFPMLRFRQYLFIIFTFFKLG